MEVTALLFHLWGFNVPITHAGDKTKLYLRPYSSAVLLYSNCLKLQYREFPSWRSG